MVVHRYLGLATLGFLFLASVTGCILCFAKPLDAALNADLFGRPTGAVTDPVVLVDRFAARHPEVRVIGFPLHVAASANIPVAVVPAAAGGKPGFDQAFLDGGNGRLVGTRLQGAGWDRRHIVSGIFSFHYTLLAGKWGRWIMGVVAVGWLVGNLVGFYLTLPERRPFWRNWRQAWRFRWRSLLPKMMFDLHSASGLWLLGGVIVLSFTSVAMNFFDEAFTPIVEAVSPAKPSPFDLPGVAGRARLDFAGARGLAERRALQRGLDWRAATASYSSDRNMLGISFTASGVENYSRLGPVSYWFDGMTGAFRYEDSAGRKLSRALYPLHSGEVAGWAGITMVFVLGLATIEMCVTGFYVWLRKRRSRVAARTAKRRRG